MAYPDKCPECGADFHSRNSITTVYEEYVDGQLDANNEVETNCDSDCGESVRAFCRYCGWVIWDEARVDAKAFELLATAHSLEHGLDPDDIMKQFRKMASDLFDAAI